MDDDRRFLNRSEDVDRHGGKLPHWQQGPAIVFVTFRLADSLPKEILNQLAEFKANWLNVHGGEWNEELEIRWKREFAAEIDGKLDEGFGCCCLRWESIRNEVVRVLQFGDGERYRIDAAVVMPNHVHLLFAPLAGGMEREIQAWKSLSSRRLSGRIGSAWPGWQRNYHDRLIRSRKHFDRVVDYIAGNGPKARLRADEYWLHVREEG